MRDLRTELEREIEGEKIPAWEPQKGDVLIGKLIRYDIGRGYRGREIHIAIIEAENITEGSPLVAVWLMHTVLFDEFRKARPAPGERVGIAHCGLGFAQSGAEYVKYRLQVDREGDDAVPTFAAPLTEEIHS